MYTRVQPFLLLTLYYYQIYMFMFLCPFRIGWMRFFEVSSWLGGPVPLLPVSAVQQKKKCSSHWPPKENKACFWHAWFSVYVLACTSLHCFLSFKFSSTSRRTSFSRFSTYACTQTNHLVKIIELQLTHRPFIFRSTHDWLCWLRCWFSLT